MSAADLTRRRVNLFATGALLAGCVGFPVGGLRAQVAAVPSGEFLLTRRLSRSLRDANTIVVTRSWRITFARQSRGITISGEQACVSVEAPPRLKALARIEEERSTSTMFPILLAPDGIIVAAGQNTSQKSVDSALTTARNLLAENGFAKGSPAQQGIFLVQLQKASAALLDEMPGDLFYPSTTPVNDIREVALPDGTAGEFELRWQASAQEGSPLLKKARREIITRIGESERTTIEEWSLTAP